MPNKVLLLVEDNSDDEALTVRSLKKNKIVNEIVVTRDGLGSLGLPLGQGAYAVRDLTGMPPVILLDLKLTKLDGLGLLRRLCDDDRTKGIPVVILTSSNEEQDRINGYALGANSYVRKPVDFEQFVQAAMQLGLYWLVLNVPPTTRTFEGTPPGPTDLRKGDTGSRRVLGSARRAPSSTIPSILGMFKSSRISRGISFVSRPA